MSPLRATLAPALALTLLAAACGDGGSMVEPAAAQGSAESALKTPPPGSVDEIEALVNAYVSAWAAKDAAAFASIYAEDVAFIAPIGLLLTGRAAVQAQHTFLFAGPFAGSVSTIDVRGIEFLTGTIAVVELDVGLTGYRGLPPGLAESEPGAVNTRATWVVQKRQGEWEIILQQHTAIAPGV